MGRSLRVHVLLSSQAAQEHIKTQRAGRGMPLQLCPSSGQGCTHSSTGSQPPLILLSCRGKSCYSESHSHQHISTHIKQ